MEKRKKLAILVLVLGLLVWLAGSASAAEMGTAITYQGRLIDANTTADGLYDFAFKLYDTNVGGSKAANDVNVADVDVIDGYFTVELDFGSVYDGNGVWLEIGVRPGDLEDPNVYTTLSPRQRITPTPYASYAKTAGSDNDWMVSGNDMYSIPSGNVGIGTTSPGARLQVGDTDVGHDVYIAGATNSQSGLFFYDGAIPGGMRYNFSTDDLSIFTSGSTRVMIDSAGNVGIGTMSPSEKLEVNGKVSASAYTGSSPVIFEAPSGTERMRITDAGKVGIGTTSPTSPLTVLGQIESTSNGFKFPDGTTQTTAMGSSAGFTGGPGSNPSATTAFLSPTRFVAITSSGQRIYVSSNKALGSAAVGGAANLNLYIGYRVSGSGAVPTLVGGGCLGMRVPQNTRVMMGLSAIITGLAPGTYEVGLAGSDNGLGNWNSNEWGYTTAFVF